MTKHGMHCSPGQLRENPVAPKCFYSIYVTSWKWDGWLCMEFYCDHSFNLNSQRDAVKNIFLGKCFYFSNFTVSNNICLQILKIRKKSKNMWCIRNYAFLQYITLTFVEYFVQRITFRGKTCEADFMVHLRKKIIEKKINISNLAHILYIKQNIISPWVSEGM